MLDRIQFLFGEAFAALRRNTWMTFSAVSTAAVALYLCGSIGYAYRSVSEYAKTLPNQFEMRVFLKANLTKVQISAAAKQIRAIPGVKQATLISRDQAWAKFKAEHPDITRGEQNPLPNSFKVTLTDLDRSAEVAAGIRNVKGVETDGVRYLDDLQQLIKDTLSLLRAIGLVAGGLLFLTSGVLIYNAIRLTIVARRREIRIMQLVGATRLMVVTPLLIEGAAQGLVGGVIATFLIWISHRGVERIVKSVSAFGEIPAFPLWSIMGFLVLLGGGYGLVCSWIAARNPTGRFRGIG